MSTDVIMPVLGMSQETGTVLQWFKAAGELVTKGEPLMEIETDKVTVEIEAPASGVLTNVSVTPGDVVPVGQVIALIEASVATSTAAPVAVVPEARATVGARAAASPVASRIAADHDLDLRLVKPLGERIKKDDVLEFLATQRSGVGATNGARRVAASPKARRLAAERGIDLAAVAGSGPAGAVLAADVVALATPSAVARMDAPSAQPVVARDSNGATPVPYIETNLEAAGTTSVSPSPSLPSSPPSYHVAPHPPAPKIAPASGPTGDIIRPSGMGRLMAQRTTESFRDTPHFYLTRELPARALIEIRERLLPSIEKRTGVRLSLTDLLIRIMAEALAEHPLANASWQDNAIRVQPTVNLGVAAATPQGLLVPVIRDTTGKNLAVIARERADLAGRAVAGTLAPDDLAGSTATLSNLGMYHVDMFQAIINPPHSAILAVGRVAERPVVRDGQIVAAHTFWVTGSFDHRVLDGARAAEFLHTFATLVEEPLGLL